MSSIGYWLHRLATIGGRKQGPPRLDRLGGGISIHPWVQTDSGNEGLNTCISYLMEFNAVNIFSLFCLIQLSRVGTFLGAHKITGAPKKYISQDFKKPMMLTQCLLTSTLQGFERDVPDVRVPVHCSCAAAAGPDRHDGLRLHHRHHLPRQIHRHLQTGNTHSKQTSQTTHMQFVKMRCCLGCLVFWSIYIIMFNSWINPH